MRNRTKNKLTTDFYPGVRQLKSKNRLKCKNRFQNQNTKKQINGFKFGSVTSGWKTELSEWFTDKLNRVFTNMENIFGAEEPIENSIQNNHKIVNKDIYLKSRVVEWQMATTSFPVNVQSYVGSAIPLVEKISAFLYKLRKNIRLTLLLDLELNVESINLKSLKNSSKADADKFTIKAKTYGDNLMRKTLSWLEQEPVNGISKIVKTSWFAAKQIIHKKIFSRKEFRSFPPHFVQKVFIGFRLFREQLE